MSLPKTFKAVVIDKPGADFTIKDVPLEDPKAEEVLIKVSHCGVCGTDSHVQKGQFGEIENLILGHEFIGKVVALGKGSESRWKEGDIVGGAWHGGHCANCKPCNKGLFQMCTGNKAVNGVSKNGGYGQYAYLRSEAAVRIPEGIDLAEAAPLLCAGVTVFNGIRQMNLTPGDTVAIQGLGGLGHLALQYSRKMGYRTVAISSSDSKRKFATDLGAHDYIDTSKEDAAEALKKIGGANLVVVTAPTPDAIGPLLNGMAPVGKLLVLAPVGDAPVNTVAMITNGLSVHGWPSGSAVDCEEAIDFAQVHGVKCMIEKFPLSKVKEAVTRMEEGKVRFRAVLVMDEQ